MSQNARFGRALLTEQPYVSRFNHRFRRLHRGLSSKKPLNIYRRGAEIIEKKAEESHPWRDDFVLSHTTSSECLKTFISAFLCASAVDFLPYFRGGTDLI